jgi:hypothetical protein
MGEVDLHFYRRKMFTWRIMENCHVADHVVRRSSRPAVIVAGGNETGSRRSIGLSALLGEIFSQKSIRPGVLVDESFLRKSISPGVLVDGSFSRRLIGPGVLVDDSVTVQEGQKILKVTVVLRCRCAW